MISLYVLKHKDLVDSFFLRNFALQIYADDGLFRRVDGFET